MTDRAQIIDKVKALRARAGDAASSPAEVEAAARRAAKLIAEHELTEADLREATADAIQSDGVGRGRRTQPVHLKYCANAIERLSETKGLWFGGGELRFFGFPEDVAFAIYLTELVNGAANRAWSIYAERRAFPHKTAMQAARRDFLEGFGHEVSYTFHRAASQRNAARQAAQATGTDLVVLKGQIIAGHLAANLPKIGAAKVERKKRRMPDLKAMAAGAHAGSRISPSRPLEHETEEKDAIQ